MNLRPTHFRNIAGITLLTLAAGAAATLAMAGTWLV